MRPPSRRAFLGTVAAGVLVGRSGRVTATARATADDPLPLRETVTLDADLGVVSDLARSTDGSLAVVTLDEGGHILGLDEFGRRTSLTPVADTAFLTSITHSGANTVLVGGNDTDEDPFVGDFHLDDGWQWRVTLPDTADRVVDVHELPDGTVFVASSIPTPSGADSDLFWIEPEAGTVEREANLDEQVTHPSVRDIRVTEDGSVTVVVYGYDRARGFALRYDAERTLDERINLGSRRNLASNFLVTGDGYRGAEQTDDADVQFIRFDGEGGVASKTVAESPHSLSPGPLVRGVDGGTYAVGTADPDRESPDRAFLADAATGAVTTTAQLPEGVATRAFLLDDASESPTLLAGGYRDDGTDRAAWLGTFSERQSPTPTATTTQTPTATTTPTETPTRTPSTDTSTTTTPGFSLATVAGALGLGAVELFRRYHD